MNKQDDKKFDSVILAGGFGSRMNPLTDSLPKPMLPIFGISAYERNLALLRKSGFMRTAVTTMYLPEKIEKIKSDGIVYLRESTPMGSAGAIARLKGQADDCLLIISGDAVTDFDLKKAKDDFLKSGSDAGIVLSRTNDSGEYGSVCLKDGKIVGFCEKPSVRDTLSDLINTGIYFIKSHVLDLIPEREIFDFAHDLFPLLLKREMPIAGIEPDGHWFDIGSFSSYHQCNMWFSGGESCIGKSVSIHGSARIDKSVIMNGCTIGNSVISGSIIGENVVIGNDCIIPRGCVIGPGAELRDGCSLAPGSIIQTGATLIGDALVDCFKNQKCCFKFGDDSVLADDGDDGYFVRFGRALGGNGDVIAFAEGSGITLPKACVLACGVSESGSNCTVISGGNAAVASFAAMEYRCTTAYIFKSGDCTEIRLFTPRGMPYSREQLRALSAKENSAPKNAGAVYLLPHGALIKRYLQYLRENTKIPTRFSTSVSSESRFLSEISEELSLQKDASLRFHLDSDGEKAYAITESGRQISYWQLIVICCIFGKRDGIILPNDTPESVERILKRHSVDVAFYGDSESDVRSLAENDRLHRDGVLLALTAQSIAEGLQTSLASLADRLPPFSVVTRSVYADRDRMCSVISRLRDGCGITRCVGFDFGEGKVSVYASASGRFRLIAEAVDNETAEEIALRAIDKLAQQ